MTTKADEYIDFIERYCHEIAADPGGRTPDDIVARLAVPHPANVAVAAIARNACGINATQWDAAIRRKIKWQEKQAAATAKQTTFTKSSEDIRRRFNLSPTIPITDLTERIVTAGHLQGWQMDYGRNFSNAENKPVEIDSMVRDLLLDVADAGLTEDPFRLKDRNFERAVDEWVEQHREERKQEVWSLIKRLPEYRNRAEVEANFEKMCKRFFKTNWRFAGASVRKVMWQVKRKMARLPIKDHHCVITYGKQSTGKTYFWGLLRKPLEDLTKQVDVADLLGENQLDLYSYFLIDLDELAKADRVDLAKFKTMVTKQAVSRRVYYTQRIKDVPMSAVLVGSTNIPVALLIQDPTGMRRFIQLDVNPRDKAMEDNWDADVENADWMGFWQMVDHEAEDPMIAFDEELKWRQEKLRTKNRVEQWLDAYEFQPRVDKYIKETSNLPHLVQFQAKALYDIYRAHDRDYGSGQPMTLGNWGLQMKALIEDGRAPEWTVYEPSPSRTYYTYKPDNVVRLGLPQPAAAAGN